MHFAFNKKIYFKVYSKVQFAYYDQRIVSELQKRTDAIWEIVFIDHISYSEALFSITLPGNEEGKTDKEYKRDIRKLLKEYLPPEEQKMHKSLIKVTLRRQAKEVTF